MNIRCPRLEAKPAMALFYSPEPTEEKKNVARPNTVVIKMALGRLCLTEQRTPTRLSWQRIEPQVRVKMNAIACLQ